jgi:hypothetical protein
MEKSEIFAWYTGVRNARFDPDEALKAASAAIGRAPSPNEIGLFALALGGSMDALAPLLPLFGDFGWQLRPDEKGFIATAFKDGRTTSAGGKTPGLALITAIFRLWSLSRVH